MSLLEYPTFDALDEEDTKFCLNEATKINNVITYFKVLHAYAFLVCIYREIFDTKVGMIGGVMKTLELFGIYLYFAGIVQSLAMFSFWMYELPLVEM